MSFITRCTECKTAFHLQAEQLSAANGWVRCGACDHSFEADKNLYELTDQPWLDLSLGVKEEKPIPQKKPKSGLFLKSLIVLTIAALVIGSLLQIALIQRNWIAAVEPTLGPWLTKLCDCQLQWPMDAKAVHIESSRFELQEDGRYLMEFQLKNTLSYPIATPSIELQLTNSDDQVVVQKIIRPEQLGLTDVLRPQRNQLAKLVFSLNESLPVEAVGFKVKLFYP
ncbi:MAG: DUF3426 domain-containing protein [Limnohabitans sp.]|nr:DUF3426 domain-containing protein [Limnohabitans sp.]